MGGERVSPYVERNYQSPSEIKGLSQQELAVKVNVVRQTISKWEQGLSVPDSDLLIALSEALETPVSTLLGETVAESEADEVKALSEKLEIINLQFARRKAMRRSALHWLLIVVCGGYPGRRRGSGRGKQSLSGLGLQRPGNRRHGAWSSTPLNGPSSAWRPLCPDCGTGRRFSDAKT